MRCLFFQATHRNWYSAIYNFPPSNSRIIILNVICMIWPVTINVGKEWMIVYFLSPLWFSPSVYSLPSFTLYLSVWLSLFHIRDILPFTLKLPEIIHSAATLSDLHEVAQQGAGTDQACLTHLKYHIKHRYGYIIIHDSLFGPVIIYFHVPPIWIWNIISA